MNISEAAEKVGLTPVTLRYYERVGLIPPIKRKNGGVRVYSDDDLQWLDFIKCMRSAGLSVESLIEYTALFQEGEKTKEARKQILLEERKELLEKYQELANNLARLDQKIAYYE